MRTFIAGAAAGIVLGVLGTLGVQRLRERQETAEASRTVQMFEVAQTVVERALPGSRVLDVALQTPASASVSYPHEELYDAVVTYQLNERIKKVTLPFGRTKDGLIFPSTTEVVAADDKAAVIQHLDAGQHTK